jgi:DNA-binding Lrp family transcriptional regulator
MTDLTLKQSLLKTLNEDGPQTTAQLKVRIRRLQIRDRTVLARLWELRRDGKVERDDAGVYTALVQPDAPRLARPALGNRRQEALTRLEAILEVNKDRIPPEVARALMGAWQEYIDAFGEDIRKLLEQIMKEALPDVQAGQ